MASRTMLEVDRQIVQDIYRRRNVQLVEAKTSYFTKKVVESKDNPNALFRLTRNMMGNSGETILPLHTCKRNLANDFSAFFYNKILTIRSELGLPGLYICGSMTISFSGTPITTFMKIYCMYTKPVSDIIQRHGLSHHSYADDTQLYMTMDHSNNNWWDGLARIQLCVSEIREWMNHNMLKLNDDKTGLIVFTSKYKQDLYNDLSITIGDTVVDCSSQVKDLGAIFDRVLSLRQHVSYTSKTC